MGVEYTALELNDMGDKGKALRAELAERTGRTSVPNIFISGEGIGGCNDGGMGGVMRDAGCGMRMRRLG